MLTDSLQLAPDGQPYQLTRLQNAGGMTVTLMDWGATWLSAVLPLKSGKTRELLLGCRTPADYQRQAAYLGATVGRYANRIAYASLLVGNKPHPLLANQGEHQLHGGPEGFNARRWRIVQQDTQQVSYALHSPDGDQGFPGNLEVQVNYRLTADNRLEISYQARTDRACPVNLTNHAYFNLDGADTDARRQRLQLFADRYLPVDSEGIPNAELTPVDGSGMDFRHPKTLLQDFLRDRDQQRVKGYDHAYLLHRTCGALDCPAAHLWSADGQVQMSVFTSAPALQLYSGNYLDGTPARDGGSYASYAGIALESEFLPDSPHHPEWPQPDCWLKPGQQYQSATHYQFYPI
ncbi:galactose-1-epimerase [Serratia sp. TSA_198.1]|uniref:Aldose 1-epimerase n=1 Tax=Serratia plymuthica TaxID=82996 RepID=A0A2X4UF23_SERPL|nr:galactose-1-epimerase [Serratia plymuthica]NIC24840.1 galactose-1-epimerase [Serratia plymuthica]QPS21939.1 galactose-1-epimerase [Serratia plymuthica]QPS63551.1 galactose-1-epimerase [Serratia plymuthica]QPS89552.1 galactose-1-epimerase [Serratia plymuthica]RKS64082.1 aldose 1-epimerase [Serratia plymuthica]